MITKQSHNTDKKKWPQSEMYLLGLDLAWRIASPLVVLLLLAIFLDKYFQTKPIFILLAIFLAMPCSFYLTYLKYKKINVTSSGN